MKLVLRSFSVGLITAASIIGFFYIQDDTKQISTSEKDFEINIETAKDLLEEKGFVVVEQQSWQQLNEQLKVQEDQVDQQSKQEETTDQTTTEEESPDVENELEKESGNPSVITIKVSTGMTSYDVARILYEQNLIEDEDAFITYLEDEDYSRFLQIGTFELKEGMSFYEIAEALTN